MKNWKVTLMALNQVWPFVQWQIFTSKPTHCEKCAFLSSRESTRTEKFTSSGRLSNKIFLIYPFFSIIFASICSKSTLDGVGNVCCSVWKVYFRIFRRGKKNLPLWQRQHRSWCQRSFAPKAFLNSPLDLKWFIFFFSVYKVLNVSCRLRLTCSFEWTYLEN